MTALVDGNLRLCFFCDGVSSKFMANNYGGVDICEYCEMGFPIKSVGMENGECCVCFENNTLIQLPTCVHKLCWGCCKTNYFGVSANERPISWQELAIESHEFPYETNDEDVDNDPGWAKYNEYSDYSDEHFDIENKTYDELIVIRDALISERPEWMNTEEMLQYENENLRMHTECVRCENEYGVYQESKTVGSRCCPLCRAEVKIVVWH